MIWEEKMGTLPFFERAGIIESKGIVRRSGINAVLALRPFGWSGVAVRLDQVLRTRHGVRYLYVALPAYLPV